MSTNTNTNEQITEVQVTLEPIPITFPRWMCDLLDKLVLFPSRNEAIRFATILWFMDRCPLPEAFGCDDIGSLGVNPTKIRLMVSPKHREILARHSLPSRSIPDKCRIAVEYLFYSLKCANKLPTYLRDPQADQAMGSAIEAGTEDSIDQLIKEFEGDAPNDA